MTTTVEDRRVLASDPQINVFSSSSRSLRPSSSHRNHTQRDHPRQQSSPYLLLGLFVLVAFGSSPAGRDRLYYYHHNEHELVEQTSEGRLPRCGRQGGRHCFAGEGDSRQLDQGRRRLAGRDRISSIHRHHLYLRRGGGQQQQPHHPHRSLLGAAPGNLQANAEVGIELSQSVLQSPFLSPPLLSLLLSPAQYVIRSSHMVQSSFFDSFRLVAPLRPESRRLRAWVYTWEEVRLLVSRIYISLAFFLLKLFFLVSQCTLSLVSAGYFSYLAN